MASKTQQTSSPKGKKSNGQEQQQQENTSVTPVSDMQQTPETLPAAAAVAAPAARPRQSAWETIKTVAFRMLMFYFVTRFFRRPTAVNPAVNTTMPFNPSNPGAVYVPGNLFASGDPIDMYMFINEESLYRYDPQRVPIWELHDLKYGDWSSGPGYDGTRTKYFEFPISEAVQNNGSLYMHVVVTKRGYSIDPNEREQHSPLYTFSKTKRLNKYKKKVYKKTKNLLTGNTEQDEEYQKKADDKVVELLSHWHPNMTINLLDDQSPWVKGSIPPPLDKFIDFDVYSGKYYPVLYLNDYWNLLADYYPINNTFTKLNLTITVAPIQLWKWQMYISQHLRQSWYGNILGDEENDDDQDAIKRALVETNPYLLVMTILVSIVHTIFEILAFKNDIQFWRTRKSLEGLSVRSVFFNIFQSLIVILYVFDNETNTMVRISVCVGLLIELWKLPKILIFERVHNQTWFGIIPKYKYIYKSSYTDTSTSDYDRTAFKYLSWALFPLVIGYACYLLMYHEQKSWYSFCLSTIYGFLLTFGFIMMTPQLFINYKLKSVSHLPWRMMTYKALNTFIDDMFAFVIKMPTMYRIGCFRDDIIFFIYLYQRYIYPVDRKRMNEFGTTGEIDSALVPMNQSTEHNELSNEPVDDDFIVIPSASSSVDDDETLRHRRVSTTEVTSNDENEPNTTIDEHHAKAE